MDQHISVSLSFFPSLLPTPCSLPPPPPNPPKGVNCTPVHPPLPPDHMGRRQR